jgi:hypothetical protein
MEEPGFSIPRRLLSGDFTFEQPDPIAVFGLPATVGLSIGVVATVIVSGLSEFLFFGGRVGMGTAAFDHG